MSVITIELLSPSEVKKLGINWTYFLVLIVFGRGRVVENRLSKSSRADLVSLCLS